MKRVIVAAVAALLAVPVAASARVIQAETVLPPGESGHVPQSGTNPHLDDQVALFESFGFTFVDELWTYQHRRPRVPRSAA